MPGKRPLVSIGLPTHNGARFLREALDSLLAQDYPNLEILVSDNASTDTTGDILREYAALDARIRVIRHETNIGAPANFNLVFRTSSGEYFMWAADDDRWVPTYVSTCVRALETKPEAVLACTRVRFITESGASAHLDPVLYDNPDVSSPSVGRRVQTLLSRGGWYQVYGLMRRDSLARTRLFTRSYGPDVVLLVELALLGPFVRVDETLFEYRFFDVRLEPDRGALNSALESRERVVAAPFTHLQEAISRAIATADVGRVDKIQAWLAMLSAVYLRATPLRGWVSEEVGPRLRLAFLERDFRNMTKYAFVGAVLLARRLLRKIGATIPL